MPGLRKYRGPRSATFTLLMALAAGCGGGHGLQTVRGKVLYKGQPAAGATVAFHREGPPPAGAAPGETAPTPSAVVDEQGSFTLGSGDWGAGAPTGHYKVLIAWPDTSKYQALDEAAKTKLERKVGRDAARQPVDRLKGRYSKSDKPVFTADVKEGSNDLPPFDLTD